MGINHSSRVEVYVHIVWSTWDRAPLLSAEVRPRVYLCIREEAARLRSEIIAIGGIEDHVHVLLRLPATVALATLVKQLKGSSSHLANHDILPRGFKWQGGYGASSVSRRAVPRVRDYILRQEITIATEPSTRWPSPELVPRQGARTHSPRRRTSRISSGEFIRSRGRTARCRIRTAIGIIRSRRFAPADSGVRDFRPAAARVTPPAENAP